MVNMLSSKSPPTIGELTASLSAAVIRGNYEIVRVLLEAGADPNIQPIDHMLPIMCAVENRNKGITELLIKYGANPNARHDGNGFTPLHLAVDVEGDAAWQSGEPPNIAIIEILLASGADPSIKNEIGSTAYDVAKDYEFKEAMHVLSTRM